MSWFDHRVELCRFMFFQSVNQRAYSGTKMIQKWRKWSSEFFPDTPCYSRDDSLPFLDSWVGYVANHQCMDLVAELLVPWKIVLPIANLICFASILNDSLGVFISFHPLYLLDFWTLLEQQNNKTMCLCFLGPLQVGIRSAKNVTMGIDFFQQANCLQTCKGEN